MSSRLLADKYTAIKQLLRILLATACSYADGNQNSKPINQENIHLYKSRDFSRILYISGVALQQKKSQNLHSMKFAQKIASCFSANYAQEVKVEIVPPGLIYLELTPQLLASWLQCFVSGTIGCEIRNKSGNSYLYWTKEFESSSSSFALQYAYARCCSLIKLAAHEKLIELKKNNALVSPLWMIVNPLPIPWLQDKQELRLVHPAERGLMSELIKAVDSLNCSFVDKTVNWEKTALGLSQSFENFWSNCRIWGELKNNNRELAQARIGLIMVSRLVFEQLLKEKFGLIAPQEL